MSSNEPTSETGGSAAFPWAPPQPGAPLTPLLEAPYPLTPPPAPPNPGGIDSITAPRAAPVPEPVEHSRHRRVRRKVLRWVLLLLITALVASSAAVAAGAWRYAEINRRDAEDSLASSREWQQRAETQQTVIDEQVTRLAGFAAEIVSLKAQIAALERNGQEATARADGLQALLDDTTRRLTEAENRAATLAGEQARAVDDRILGR